MFIRSCTILVAALLMMATSAYSQDWRLNPDNYIKLSQTNFDPNPYSFYVDASGPDKVTVSNREGEQCLGYVTLQPQVDVYYENDAQGSRTLKFDVTSSTDTVLLVTGPDGDFDCIDDAKGRDPSLSYSNATTGLYSIWVGTYSKSDRVHRAYFTVSH